MSNKFEISDTCNICGRSEEEFVAGEECLDCGYIHGKDIYTPEIGYEELDFNDPDYNRLEDNSED